jgi:hypothetical protein
MVKRYQMGNQNPEIAERQTTQWPKDTKGVIRICISQKDRQHHGQKDKQRSTKHDTEYLQVNNMNPSKNRRCIK